MNIRKWYFLSCPKNPKNQKAAYWAAFGICNGLSMIISLS